MKNRDKWKLLAFIVIVVLCLWYLHSKGTYTSYSSEVNGEADSKIAGWHIKIDKEEVTTVEEKNIQIKDISWEGTRVEDGKVAPGSVGKMNIEIDPTGTEVAIKYDLEVVDKKVDAKTILTVKNITQSDVELIRTGPNTYTSVLTLDMIDKGIKPVVQMDIEWENDDNVNDLEGNDFDLDSFFKINFSAVQYRGEEIVAYSE